MADTVKQDLPSFTFSWKTKEENVEDVKKQIETLSGQDQSTLTAPQPAAEAKDEETEKIKQMLWELLESTTSYKKEGKFPAKYEEVKKSLTDLITQSGQIANEYTQHLKELSQQYTALEDQRQKVTQLYTALSDKFNEAKQKFLIGSMMALSQTLFRNITDDLLVEKMNELIDVVPAIYIGQVMPAFMQGYYVAKRKGVDVSELSPLEICQLATSLEGETIEANIKQQIQLLNEALIQMYNVQVGGIKALLDNISFAQGILDQRLKMVTNIAKMKFGQIDTALSVQRNLNDLLRTLEELSSTWAILSEREKESKINALINLLKLQSQQTPIIALPFALQ